MADKKEPGVSTQRQEYTEMLPFVLKNRRALAGERAVKASGVMDLPPLPSMCCGVTEDENGNTTIINYGSLTAEGKVAYAKYKSLAVWFGAVGITVIGLVGLIQSKPANKKLNTDVDYLIDNVDGKGTTLRKLASQIYTDAFITPWSGVLSAYDGSDGTKTLAQVKAEGRQPKIMFYNFESIINWAEEVIANQTVFTLIVLKESVTIRKGFEVKQSVLYRKLELIKGIYHQSTYDEDEELLTGPVMVFENGEPMRRIPFEWNKTGENGGSYLDALIDMNFHHYRISADYGGKLHYSSFAIFYETGAKEDSQNFQIGNGVKWNNESDEATFGVIEPDGNADGLRLSQKDDQERMAALGADALRPRSSGVESAEAKTLDKVTQHSMTADIAITTGNTLTKAINTCSVWLGGKDDNTYSPNTDYVPTGMDAGTFKEMVNAVSLNKISWATFYEQLQKGEIASTERDAEEERKFIDEDIKHDELVNSGMNNTEETNV